jgi:hypothetical protein
MMGKNTWSKHKTLSEAHKNALRNSWLGKHLTTAHRRKISEAQRGSKSVHWKGGINAELMLIRHSIEFRLWCEAVFARDNWTCQKCGRIGGNLHPHHIKGFTKYPELRFAINNGITLCAGKDSCHAMIHKEQYNEYRR